MHNKNFLRFVAFVKKHIGTDHLDIAEYFSSDIEAMAADCRIDWNKSKNKLNWNGSKHGKQEKVVGLTSEDTGRVYVFPESKRYEKDGESFTYPTVGFASYQNTYGQPSAKFNALGLLYDEYEKFKAKNIIPKAKKRLSNEEKAARIAEVTKDSEEKQREMEAYLAAEPKRYEKMRELTKDAKVYSPYLQDKKVNDVAKGIGIKIGVNNIGYFTCFPLYNIWGEFGGVQRIYHEKPEGWDNNKRTSWGFNTTGFFFIIGQALSTCEMVYIVEGLATGLAMHKATGRTVIVCLYAGNIGPVSKAITEEYPNVKKVHVADNDKDKPDSGNTGVSMCAMAVRDNGGFVFVPKPSKGSDACDVLVNDGLETLKAQIHDTNNYFNGRFSKDVGGVFNNLEAA